MSPALEIIPTIASAAVTTALAALATRRLVPILDEQRKRREKRRIKIKDFLNAKLSKGIALSIQDILDIARGSGGSTSDGIEALYELYASTEDQEAHGQLKALLSEYNREEPFESLPEEARPSLARLSTLCEESPLITDRELLHPIRKLLDEYQMMKLDHQAIKKQSSISYVVAIVSFFIGAIGLILAFQGPSKDFFAKEIRAALSEKLELKQ